MNILRRWVRFFLSFTDAGNKSAKTPVPKDTVIAVLTQYHVKTSHHNQFSAMVSAYVFSSLKAAGNKMAAAYYEQGDTSVVWIVERWICHAFYVENRESNTAETLRRFADEGAVQLQEAIVVKELYAYAASGRRKALLAAEPLLTVMLFIDVISGTEEQFRQLNRIAIAEVRKEPGLLDFRFCEECNHTTRFVVYKRFKNREAFQAHLKNPAVAPVISFLQTSIKEPPFEREYHHLIEFAPLYRKT